MSATALVRSTIRSNALQLSKEKKINNLNGTRQELLEKIGLNFNEFGELVVGYVDIENYITLFLSQSGVQSAVTTPTNSIMMVPMAEMVTPFHRVEKCQSENH